MIKSNGQIGEFDYSRVNCWILAHLLMEATGRSFEDIFTEFVSKPAHLKKTVAAVEGTFSEIKAKLPNLVDDSYPTNRDFSSCIGSANVISTPSDLIRWNNYLHNKLESKLRTIMLTFNPANKSFDYGMSLKSKNGRVWHTGHIGCFRALLFNYQKKNVVLLTNDPTKYFVINDALTEYFGVNCS
jgi:CubicO group peptidase (beta-lactamase class C family)